MIEEKCFKGVPFSEQGQAQKCHDRCEYQGFQGSEYPVSLEEQQKSDYEGDWNGGYGCHWLGWK